MSSGLGGVDVCRTPLDSRLEPAWAMACENRGENKDLILLGWSDSVSAKRFLLTSVSWLAVADPPEEVAPEALALVADGRLELIVTVRVSVVDLRLLGESTA